MDHHPEFAVSDELEHFPHVEAEVPEPLEVWELNDFHDLVSFGSFD